MNNGSGQQLAEIADTLALGIQKVRDGGLLPDGEILLNLDYSRQAKSARFVFDMARGRLHRQGCAAIPPESESALYFLEEIDDSDTAFSCPVCRPEPAPAAPPDPAATFDVLYGILSIVSQFSSVLKERGREFRAANTAGVWKRQLEQLLASFQSIHAPAGVSGAAVRPEPSGSGGNGPDPPIFCFKL